MGSTELDVSLDSDENTLSDVVVTALGIKQERKTLGYSIQEVKGSDIADTQRDNFLVSLQGRAAGLNMTTTSGQPGASAAIQLRGASSIGGNNQPLFVVDGLPIDNRTFSQGGLVSDRPNRDNDYLNRAADINPNDIESITILKGPEAAALYGIDASSGAIVITTKKGTKGAAGKGKVTYDNRFKSAQLYRFPEVQTVFGRGAQGYLNPASTSFFGPKYGADSPIFDNVGSFFQRGTGQMHNLGFEGGNDVATYRLSTQYVDETGIVPTTGMKKLSVRLTGTAKILPKLEVVTSLNYINTRVAKAQRSTSGYLIGLLSWPANDDVTNYLNPDGTRRTLLGGISQGEGDNPFFAINKNQLADITDRTMGNISLNYTPTKWLTLVGRFGADIYSTQSNLFLHPESWQTGGGGFQTKGSIENAIENNQLLNGNLLATVKKTVGKLSSSFTFGGTFDDRNYKITTAYGEKLYLPDYNSLNNTDPTTMRAKYTQTRQRLVSLLGTATFNYNNDLLVLTLTGRNDWSSTLPVANNAFFYSSASLAFNITDLPAFRDMNKGTLSYAKLRLSYGQTGKDAPPYRVLSSLTPQTTTGGGFGYGFYGGNPNLKPERGQSYEIGAELEFFKGKVGFDIAYYNKELSEQIVVQRLSYGTGFIFGLLNGGTYSNRGVEVQMRLRPVKTKSFEWNILTNFTKLTTDVKNLPADVPEYYNSDTWLYGNARSSAFVGNLPSYFPKEASVAYRTINWDYYQRGMGSAQAIGGYGYARNAKGDILIDPRTGLPITNSTFLPIGDRNPDFMIGLTNSLRYKSMRLSFLLDIRKGGDVFNGTAMYLWRTGLGKSTLDRETPVTFKGVLRDGREDTDNPTKNTIQINPTQRSADYYGSIPESEFVEKNINWLRLRDVTLSYDVPKVLLARTKAFKQASVFFTGTDLFLMSNYTGADPNVNGNSATTLGTGAGGFDYGTLSMPRGYAVGLRVGF